MNSLLLVFILAAAGVNAGCPSGFTSSCPSGFNSPAGEEVVTVDNLDGCVWFCKCTQCFGCTVTDASTNEALTNVDILTRVDVQNSAGGSTNLQSFIDAFMGTRFADTKSRSCASEERMKTSKTVSSLGESLFSGFSRLQLYLGSDITSEAQFEAEMDVLESADLTKVQQWGSHAYDTMGHATAMTSSRLTTLETRIEDSLDSTYEVSVTSKTHSGYAYAEVAVCTPGDRIYRYNVLVTEFTAGTASGQPLLFSRVASETDGVHQYRWNLYSLGDQTECIKQNGIVQYIAPQASGGRGGGLTGPALMTSGSATNPGDFNADWNSDLAGVEPYVRSAVNQMRFDIVNGVA